MSHPFISICIPAYKRVRYLERLLDSISLQNFRDYEVIVSDDSDDDSVQDLIKKYESRFNLHYFRNRPSLGTPANWNFAISKASGEWIKLMHDDDWFASPGSLHVFTSHTDEDARIIFSGYNNIYEEPGKPVKPIVMSSAKTALIKKEPRILLLENYIGPPSVSLLHNSIKEEYDDNLKWRVDCEFYARVLHAEKSFLFINETLINIGISASQVTNDCINNPAVELPEGFILLKKHGVSALRNIRIYDGWWRLLRNMGIKDIVQLSKYSTGKWPVIITEIVRDMGKAPSVVFKYGLASKLFMLFSFLRNRHLAT